MNQLNTLRGLADRQQFAALLTEAAAWRAETGDPRLLPLQALAQAHCGQREASALACAEASALVGVLDDDARVDLAGAWCALLRADQAEPLLEGVLGRAPQHPLALARLGWVRLQQGRREEARDLYAQAVEHAPHRLPAWLALIALRLELGEADAARLALDRASRALEGAGLGLPPEVATLFGRQLCGLQLALWAETGAHGEAEGWLDAARHERDLDDWAGWVTAYASELARRDHHPQAEALLTDALVHAPEQLGLIGQLAELAELQGRTEQAAHFLRRALKAAKAQRRPQAGLLARLATVLVQGGQGEQARRVAEQAVAAAAEMGPAEGGSEAQVAALGVQAKCALAQVESQRQNYAAAEMLYAEVLAADPWHVPALHGFGKQELQRGRLEEAVALFERVAEIDPARGHAALITARRFPEDEATLERLERLARQHGLEGSVRSGLLFQLAAAWEKREDYARAMALADAANAASRKFLRYDPRGHRQACARIRHAFPRALYEHRANCGLRASPEARLPVFVVGMPRSGTTLVEQILAGHSAIHGAGELGVIPARIQGLERWERHTGSGRCYPDCVDDLSPQVVAGIAEGIVRELRAYAAESKPDARHVVDKLPHNFENIGLIKLLFPEARIISVRRDPRDIALSNYFTDYQAKHGGMGFAYDLRWIGEQLADHNLLMHHWGEVFPGEMLEVRYEDIVADLEGEARRMFEYIGVPWEPQVVAFDKLDRPVKTASVWQVRQPVYASSAGKWARYREFLGPLIAGTNARITWEPVDMVSLPEPGLLNRGYEHFRAGELDAAETCFGRLLHHLPGHAAALCMMGEICLRRGQLRAGVALIEQALERAPWKRDWHPNLALAYERLGEVERAEQVRLKHARRPAAPEVAAAAFEPLTEIAAGAV